MILIYDSTFEGFLSLIYEVYYKKLKPSNIYKKLPNEIIFEEILHIQTKKENYTKVFNAIKSKFSKQIVQRILNIFMCDSKEFEMALLEYIILGFKDSKQLLNINNSCVFYLAKHFLKRFNNQNFIIHDINRKLAFVKIGKDFSIQKVAEFQEPTHSLSEQKFQKLWKSFFKGVTIEERVNLKLQQNQIPLIYRTYMSEFL
ncbi:MAG: DNA metabolism protein [Arcobacter sp.]|nr:DNA metabolism protein [Arcobacter sp.]